MQDKGAEALPHQEKQCECQKGSQPYFSATLMEIDQGDRPPGVFWGLVVEMEIGYERAINCLITLIVVHDHVYHSIEKVREKKSQDKGQHLPGKTQLNIHESIEQEKLKGDIHGAHEMAKNGIYFSGAIELHGRIKLRLLGVKIADGWSPSPIPR